MTEHLFRETLKQKKIARVPVALHYDYVAHPEAFPPAEQHTKLADLNHADLDRLQVVLQPHLAELTQAKLKTVAAGFLEQRRAATSLPEEGEAARPKNRFAGAREDWVASAANALKPKRK